MGDLIDREAALANAKRGAQTAEEYALARAAINLTPAADAVPVVHATWINSEPEYNYECHHSTHYQCSNCGRRTGRTQARTHKFCPNCGAKMDGGNK